MAPIKLYTSLDEARSTLLRRQAPGEEALPPQLLDALERRLGERVTAHEAVARIVSDVRARGDAALLEWTQALDGQAPESLLVPDERIIEAYDLVPAALVQALEEAAERMGTFYGRQPATSWMLEELGGVLGQFVRPLERVAVYLPGRLARPSALLASALPARIAGVEEIVLCTAPGPGGTPAPELLIAADIAQIDEVYCAGHAAAIAALAYGTESIARVDKIVGSGDAFIRLAMQQVYGAVGLAGPPAPPDLVIVADEFADAARLAADLQAQAELSAGAAGILLTPSRALAEAVQSAAGEVAAGASLGIVLADDLPQACELADEYAPARLLLAVREPWEWSRAVRRAGAVYLGAHNAPSLADYAAGPGATAPGGGSARFASPLSVWDFVRLTDLVALRPEEAAAWTPIAEVLARAEGLVAGAEAIRRRGQRVTG